MPGIRIGPFIHNNGDNATEQKVFHFVIEK